MRRTTLVLCLVISAVAFAQDHWAQPPLEEQQRQVFNLMRELVRGERLDPEARAEIAELGKTMLLRGRMNVIDSARMSIAEIYLQRGEAEKALEPLNKIIKLSPDKATVALAHVNLGRIYVQHLNDAMKAAEQFAATGQPYGALATQLAVAIYEHAGEFGKAAEMLKKKIEVSTEAGARVALLNRLAWVYRKGGMNDKAEEIFKKVTDEFKPEDIEQIKQKIIDRLELAAEQIAQLHLEGRPDEAERIHRRLERLHRQLGLAGRWDERRTFEKNFPRIMRQMERRVEELERAGRRREEREMPLR